MIGIYGVWGRVFRACLCVALLCLAGCTDLPGGDPSAVDGSVESGVEQDAGVSPPFPRRDARPPALDASGGTDSGRPPVGDPDSGNRPDTGVAADAAPGGGDAQVPGMDSGPEDVDSGPGDVDSGPGDVDSGDAAGDPGDAAVDSGPGPEPDCLEEGALRCVASGSAAREICSDGQWESAEDCDPDEICDTSNTDEPGTCVPVTASCVGSAGEFICVGAVMHECNADAISVSQQACESEKHCQAGLPSEQCAICIPEEDYQCDDQSLEQCAEDGMGYVEIEACTAEAPCNAEAGACTDLFCLPGSFNCSDEGELLACNADQTAFEVVDSCQSGICDETNGQCDVCLAGSKRCTEAGDPAVCAADGQGWDVGSCGADTPICVGQGKCVQCENNDHCSAVAVEDCMRSVCSNSECTPVPDSTAANDPCSKGGTTGYCRADGACVECNNNDDHCSGFAVDDCMKAVCSSYSCTSVGDSSAVNDPCSKSGITGYCRADGACVECNNNDDHCSGFAVEACMKAVCSSYSCTSVADSSAVNDPCSKGGTTGYCRGDGACVECNNNDQHCAGFAVEDCMKPICSSYSCTAVADPTKMNTGCNKDGVNGVCNAAGGCVECNDDDNCSGLLDYCSSVKTCVECTTKNGQCTGGEVCDVHSDPNLNECVECVVATDCGDSDIWECPDNTCGRICGNTHLDPGEQCDDGSPTHSGWGDYDGCGLHCQINTVMGCGPHPYGLPSNYVTWDEEAEAGLWMWIVPHPEDSDLAACIWPCGQVNVDVPQYPPYQDCGQIAWDIPGTDPPITAECVNGGCIIPCSGPGGSCPPGFECLNPDVVDVDEWIAGDYSQWPPPTTDEYFGCMPSTLYDWSPPPD